jgi:hypothetical protein
VRVSGIWWGYFKWFAVHLLANGLLYNAAGYFHEIALRA